jgi:outer membrane protein assembly factor BamB
LNLSDGKLLWSFTAKSHIESSPAVAGGRVFFGAGDDGVYAISAEDGKLAWRFPDAHVDCAPAVADGRVFAGAGYGKTRIFCLDAATGKPVWSVPTDLAILGAPSVSGGRVYAGFGNGDYVKSDPAPKGAVLCLEAATGKQVWRTDLPDAVLSAIAIDGAEGYFGCRDGNVYAIELASGKPLRKMACGGPVLSSPTIVKGQLFVTAAGKIRLFAAATGEKLWESDLADLIGKPAGELLSSPAVSNGRLYFGTGNAAFVSIGNEAGK